MPPSCTAPGCASSFTRHPEPLCPAPPPGTPPSRLILHPCPVALVLFLLCDTPIPHPHPTPPACTPSSAPPEPCSPLSCTLLSCAFPACTPPSRTPHLAFPPPLAPPSCPCTVARQHHLGCIRQDVRGAPGTGGPLWLCPCTPPCPALVTQGPPGQSGCCLGRGMQGLAQPRGWSWWVRCHRDCSGTRAWMLNQGEVLSQAHRADVEEIS